jgi:hypothetical protein
VDAVVKRQQASQQPLRRRARLWATALAAAVLAANPAALAADNLVFVTGAFRRSVPVADLDHLARTGEARGLLGDALRLGRQDPAQVAKLLKQPVELPVVLVARLLNTRIGEAILQRIAAIIYPLKAPGTGVPALRSAVVLGLANNNGSLNAVTLLQAYPAREIEVNLPALMGLMAQTSSISELVRFFSDSPLDGLAGDGANGGADNRGADNRPPAAKP